jgi:hypothetical protein
MATTYELINKTILTGTQATVTFSSIPNTFTDLLLKISSKSDLIHASGGSAIEVKLNGTAYSSALRLESNGSTVASNTFQYINAQPDNFTANTFGNTDIYIPNYLSTTNKSISADSVGENNATLTANSFNALLYTVTAAITSVSLNTISGFNFVSGSSFYLYGIKNS